jgi:hypothetical protein
MRRQLCVDMPRGRWWFWCTCGVPLVSSLSVRSAIERSGCGMISLYLSPYPASVSSRVQQSGGGKAAR